MRGPPPSKRPAPRQDRPNAQPHARKNALRTDTTLTPPGTVTIRWEPFGTAFDVIAPDPVLSRELAPIGPARAYASIIAERFGWTVVDRSGEPS